MIIRPEVMLIDLNYDRISSMRYVYGTQIDWEWYGHVYNSTTNAVTNCKIITSKSFNNIFWCAGGSIIGYAPITSDLNTTCNFGTIVGGKTVPIVIRVLGSIEPVDVMVIVPLTIVSS